MSATETERNADDVGPVDALVIEFPAERQAFTGEMADEIARLVAADVVRILDVLIVAKGDDGDIGVLAIEEADDADGAAEALVAMAADVAETMAMNDLSGVVEDMAPGSVAGVIVFENRWAGPFASAVRRAGGLLVSNNRVPVPSILADIDAEHDAELAAGPEPRQMPPA